VVKEVKVKIKRKLFTLAYVWGVMCTLGVCAGVTTNLPTTVSGGSGTVSALQTNDAVTYTAARGNSITIGGFSWDGGAITSVVLHVKFTVDSGYGGNNPIKVNGVATTITPANGDVNRTATVDIMGGSFLVDTWPEIKSTLIQFQNNDGAGGGSQSVLFDYVYLVINRGPSDGFIPPTWSDEFEFTGAPDPSIWTLETGYKRNNELQYYTTNAWREGGVLVIEGRREPMGGYQYTSASIVSDNKFYWQYGRAQIRAKVSNLPGLWPAIWGCGQTGEWPSNGEVDIMENYGGKILANCAKGTTTRWTAAWDSANRTVNPSLTDVDPNWTNSFHIWTMQWDQQNVRLYVDNVLLNTTAQSWLVNPVTTWGPSEPFKQPFTIWLNLAIGGNAGGDPSGTPFPQRYYVDYWRIWEGATNNVAPTDIALSSYAVDEGLPSGTVVGYLSATDADPAEVIRYSLVTGTGSTHNSQFSIPEFLSDNTKQCVLKTAAVLSYGAGATRSIRVRATDIEGATYDKVLTINVNSSGPVTVTYNGNGHTGGTVPVDTNSYLSGATVTVLNNTGNLVKTGNAYIGWNTASDGSGTTYVGGNTFSMPPSDLTLYAQWLADTYTVTLNKQSGTGGSNSVIAAFGSAMPVATAPTRTGYTFGGYFTATNGAGTQYYTGAMGSARNWDIEANTTLYAKWTINTYTVLYNGNGSTGGNVPTDPSSPYDHGTTVTVFGNTGSLVKTGHSFSGWNTAADGSGTAYTPSATFASTANTTLYAQWTPDTYTISYHANGATGGAIPSDQTKTYGINLTLATNTGSLVKTGFVLSGWNTAADGSGTSYAEGATYSANVGTILYARWLPENTLTWDANGVTAGVSNGNGNWQGSNLWWDAIGLTSHGWTDGKDAFFGGGGTTANAGSITNPISAVVGSMTFGVVPGGSFSIGTAGQTITVNKGVIVNPGAPAVTVASPIQLGGAQTWQNDSGNLLLFNGLITGSSAVTNKGIGRVSVLGDNNGFSGNVTVTAGELEARTSVTATTGSFGTGNLGVIDSMIGLTSGTSFNRAVGSGSGEIRLMGGVSGFTGNGATASIITLAGGVTWGTLNFNPTEFALQRSTSASNGKATFASAIDLNGAIRTIRSDQSGGDLVNGYGTFSGNITNSSGTVAGLIKVGIGQHLLSGINTYDGGTTISEGTLRFDKIAAMPSTGVVTVNDGAILGVRVAAAGYWSGGTSGVGTLGGLLSGLGGVGTSTVVYNGNVGLLLDVTANTTYGGIIADVGTSLALHKIGSSALTLDASNTYSGGTTLYAGTVNVNSTSALGSGTITFRGGSLGNTFGAPLTLSTDNPILMIGDLGNSSFTSALNLGTGAVTLSGGNRTLNVTGGTLTIGGAIGQDGSARQLTKGGAGKLVLTSANSSFTGSMNITGGTLEALKLANGGQNSSIGASSSAATSLNINNGATLRYVGAGDSSDRLFRFNQNAAGSITLDASGTGPLNLTNTGSPTFNGNQIRTLNLIGDNTGTNTLAAALPEAGSMLSLVKDGTGTWILTGANAYTGTTTVAAGKLLINGSLSSADKPLNVLAGATLGGTGTIGRNVSIEDGGKLEFAISTVAASHDGLEISTGRDFAFAGASEITITTAGGAALGTYTLLTGGNNITGVAPAAVHLPAGWDATVSISTNSLLLTINSTSGTTYSVTYNANGATAGSVPVDGSSPYSSGMTVTVLGNINGLAMTGYTFAGWNTAANGGSTSYAPAATFSITSNTTLYAQWTPASYTVTFGANGGNTPSPTSKSVTYNATYGALATVTRTGYAFSGWFTAPSGGTEITSGTTVAITAAQTLYAHWTPSNYTVTFNANGGDTPSPTSKSVTYNATYGALATVTRAGYIFDGWFTASTGGTLVTSGTTVGTAGDHTLYAQWATMPAPTGLAATAVSSTQISLKWTDNSSDETGFLIERSGTSGTGFTSLGSAGVNVTNYTDSTVGAGETWYYRVTATNAITSSSPSAEASASTPKLSATVVLSGLSQTYDGSARTVTATTAPTGLVVIVTYDGVGIAPTNVGTYAVTGTIVSASYVGITNGTLFVSEKSVSGLTIAAVGPLTYDGSALTPEPQVNDGAAVLTKDADYTLSYADNTDAGAATVTVTGIGNYAGTQDKNFTISPAPLTVTPDVGQSKFFGAADPALTYAASGAANSETPGFSGALSRAAGESIGSYAILQNTLDLADNGAFKAANYTLSFVSGVTFAIAGKSVSTLTISDVGPFAYDGSPKTPEPEVRDGATLLTKNTDYTLSYANNTDTGTATLTVTGVGNYAGATNKTFSITQATPTVNAWPVAASIQLGQAVSNATLSGGSASVPGSFAYISPTNIPPAGIYNASVLFTPTDAVNYLTVMGSVPVTVVDVFAVPFLEPFEARQLGDLNGQFGWLAEGTVVQGTNTFGGSAKAAQIATDAGYLRHTFNDARTKVWTDMRVKVLYSPEKPAPETNATAFVYVWTNAMVMAFSGTNAVSTGVLVNQGEWVRFTFFSDYAAKTYILFVNDLRVGKYGFYNVGMPVFSELKVGGVSTFVDDIGVTPNQPAMNGMPSLILLQ
jgi:uncharacterized repeat protein (TIGR02543 family)